MLKPSVPIGLGIAARAMAPAAAVLPKLNLPPAPKRPFVASAPPIFGIDF